MNYNSVRNDVLSYLGTLLDQYDFSIVEDNSLFKGNSSKLLILFELYRLKSNQQNLNNIQIFADDIKENINDYSDLSFGSGVFGVLFVLLSLNREKVIKIDRELKIKHLSLADEYLNNLFKQKNYDLQQGAIGLGIYAIECLNNKIDSRNILIKITDWLIDSCNKKEDGVFWKYYLQNQNGLSICIGQLHGLTSILTFLSIARRYLSLKYVVKIDDLTSRGLKFLMSTRYATKGNYFPIAIDLSNSNRFNDTRSNITYCMSEIGIYFGLKRINEHINIISLNKEIVQIDEFIYNSINLNNYTNPFFCHGFTGALYYFILKHKPDYSLYSLQMIAEIVSRLKQQDISLGNANLLSGSTGIILTLLKF
ncbi:lanthionine synthetase LanC family protein [Saccharicrinis fermentans]|nr:lanthionine synthetase LanC family protein [Saccharicrinis fermentans]